MSTPATHVKVAAEQFAAVQQAGQALQAATARLDKYAQLDDARTKTASAVATKLAEAGLIRKEDQAVVATMLTDEDTTKFASVIDSVIVTAKKAADNALKEASQLGKPVQAKQAGVTEGTPSESSSDYFARKFGTR